MRYPTLLLALALTFTAGAQQQLNLQGADIRTLIETVGHITGKNFVVDPRVSGEVTVVSPSPMDADQIYEVFLSALRVNGYAAVPAGDYIKIVPELAAHQDATVLGRPLGSDDVVTHVIEVSHVPATELANLLRNLLPQSAHLIAHPGSNLLIVSDRAANVERIRHLVQRVDRGSGGEIEVIALEHASAAEVARTINALDGEGSRVIADERTNSLLLGGNPGARLRARTVISHLDTPLQMGDTAQVVYLRYASAVDMVPLLTGVAAALEQTGEDGVSATTIAAHPDTNALIISAPAAIHRNLLGVIRQLDIRRAQVLVEAIIAEVSDELARELGIQWQATSLDDPSGTGVIGGSGFPSNFDLNPGIVGLRPDDQGLINLGAIVPGLNLGYVSDGQLAALVSALDADSNSNVLSTPSIVTMDHQEAVINVGQEVPFLTGQFTSTGANEAAVNPFQTINRKDVGLKLTVTPHVNEGDAVILDIAQEVSSLSGQSGAVDLIVNKREINTRVMVADHGILVLGGLINENVQETIRMVPGLGRIPLLGNLFKYRASERSRRNLMVFIRPRILRDELTEYAVSAGKYNFMRAKQLQEQAEDQGLIDGEDLPLLPDLEDYLSAPDGAAPVPEE